MEQLQISSKDLGGIALPGFCPRCFWLKLHCRKLPFQMPFPGIFSSIDSYTKKVVEGHFQKWGTLPDWLSELGPVQRLLTVPGWSKFKAHDPANLITLTGVPDGLWLLDDGSLCIPDFKTARYTDTQDELFPMYRVQLNGYAFIAGNLGMPLVSRLALVYMEPQTSEDIAAEEWIMGDCGFVMPFSAKILEVELNLEGIVGPLLSKARQIYDSPKPPKISVGCEDCVRLEGLLQLMGR